MASNNECICTWVTGKPRNISIRNVIITYRFEDETKDIKGSWGSTSFKYVYGVAKRYAPIYERMQHGKLIGVLLEYEKENGHRTMEWIL